MAYKATKAGMIAFTQQVAIQNAEFGVRANVILPGLMDTPMAVDTRARVSGKGPAFKDFLIGGLRAATGRKMHFYRHHGAESGQRKDCRRDWPRRRRDRPDPTGVDQSSLIESAAR